MKAWCCAFATFLSRETLAEIIPKTIRMKTLKITIFIILSFFINQTILSQTKIEGTGIFKIDKTNINVIDSLLNNGSKLKTCSSSFNCQKYNDSKKTIYEMVNDSTDINIFMPLLKGHRNFIIKEYIIAGIKIENLELDFYNNTLFKIKTEGNFELQSALNDKYDEILDVEKKEIICSSVYGEYKREESTYTTTYRNDETIKAIAILRKYYNSKCEENIDSFLIINNIDITKLVKAKEEEIINQIRNKREEKKKKELEKL